jgi:hypothetical protein
MALLVPVPGPTSQSLLRSPYWYYQTFTKKGTLSGGFCSTLIRMTGIIVQMYVGGRSTAMARGRRLLSSIHTKFNVYT